MAKLDPAFIASPYYGDSSYDPIAAVRQLRLEKAKIGDARAAKLAKDYEDGLKKYTMDIKSWDDEKGYAELSGDVENLKKNFTSLSREKGLNLTKPSSSDEIMVSRALDKKMADIKHKADVWEIQKQKIDDVTKTLTSQLQKPEDERDIDVEATINNIEQWKKSEGGILQRDQNMPNLIVGKSRPVDVGKYMLDAIPKFVPGTDKLVTGWSVDSTTGRITKSTWEGVDPKRAKEGILKAYGAAPANVKNAIDRMYEADKSTLLDKSDWIVDRYGPSYGEKKDKSASGGTGSQGGGSILPVKDENGNYPLQPQIRDIYFPTKGAATDKMYSFESVGRVPIGAMFGFKNISFVGSVNNMNTETGDKESVGKAVPATPVELNMMPVASKEMSIEVTDPKTGEKTIETFGKGERIPQHVMEAIRRANNAAHDAGQAPTYLTEYQPFVTLGLSYKQVKPGAPEGDLGAFNVYLSSDGRTQSYTATSIVPYDEIKQDLIAGARENKGDWKPYDDYITEMRNQLNSSEKVAKIFEFQSKTIDDIYSQVEQ